MCVATRPAATLLRLVRPCAIQTTAIRSLATTSGRGKRQIDLGWDKLTKPLEAVPLHLPALQSLRVLHSKHGEGQSGARKFKALIPPLRWQNPHADISARWDEDGPNPRVVLELAEGGKHELHVSGQRSEEILGQVLQTAGASEEMVTAGISWATEFLRGRPPTAKPHLTWRSQLEGPAAGAAHAEEVELSASAAARSLAAASD
jgi:hypothetical protein